MADLVLGRDTERSCALWVNPEREKALNARLWEPEPHSLAGRAGALKLDGMDRQCGDEGKQFCRPDELGAEKFYSLIPSLDSEASIIALFFLL